MYVKFHFSFSKDSWKVSKQVQCFTSSNLGGSDGKLSKLTVCDFMSCSTILRVHSLKSSKNQKPKSRQNLRKFKLFRRIFHPGSDNGCHWHLHTALWNIWWIKVQGIGPVSLFSESEPRPIPNVIWLSHGLHHVNINVYAKFHQNIPLSSRVGPFSVFQNLALGKASTDDKCHFAIPWATSCQYQYVCKILELFHFFRIWRSAKPRPMINVILQSLEPDLVNINVSAKFYQNIPNGLRVKFHCFQNLNLGKTSTNPNCHLTISWATSCQY